MRHIATTTIVLAALAAFTVSISWESGTTATAQPTQANRPVKAQPSAAAPSTQDSSEALSEKERLEQELGKILAYEDAAPTDWWVAYNGDLNGTIEGGMLSVSVLNGLLLVEARKTVREGGHGIGMSLEPRPPFRLSSTRLWLDGTDCVLDEGNLAETVVAVVEPDPATFKATIAANLLCGANKDKNVRYEARFDRKSHPLGTPESYFGTPASSSKTP